MKPFLAFVKKELFHILRDRRTLLILFGLPVIQIILFGFAITNEIRDAQIVVLDRANDQTSQEVIQRLTSSGYFKINQHVQTQTEMEAAFRRGDIKMGIVFPPLLNDARMHGGKAQIQIIADASDPNTANTLTAYASAIIRSYQLEKNTAPLPMTIQVENRMTYNPEMRGVYMFVPGVITLILMLVSAMLTSITIAREKETGTMEILLVSPLNPPLIIVGKVIPYMALSFINTLTILWLAKFVFGMPFNGSLSLLLVICLLYIFTALALGILISTKVKTMQAAMMISATGLMMPTVLLSGFIFPIESMPLPLQMVANLLPAKWFNIVIKDIMIKGVGLAFIWKYVIILAGMTIVLLTISIRNFKSRLA
ncbi:MAG: ABC transporter permease [Bacteroidetes Order II. Incertae sedis bacterium]|nr:ABC transporter permease [Bacteroidetes Order II. bacterium]